ncbi:hypothetical protein QVD17_31711 [Tagetes erecta]|uniref:60S ribosomal protein L34 n=1 Tax=Tagetes erecta TaxID=13708 RepID=A0AAD8NPK3_TARER|nr:hypothetical protein QVD17_31711 [Tagetes erecta]
MNICKLFIFNDCLVCGKEKTMDFIYLAWFGSPLRICVGCLDGDLPLDVGVVMIDGVDGRFLLGHPLYTIHLLRFSQRNQQQQTAADPTMVQRLTYRKRHSYATKSNQHRVVKTPGGKLVYQTTKKRASGPKCPVTGKRIQGIPHLRPAEYKRSRLSRNRRTVNRAYGGVLSAGAVRERIIRAFLVEEQKIVKKVLKIQKAKEKTAAKS